MTEAAPSRRAGGWATQPTLETGPPRRQRRRGRRRPLDLGRATSSATGAARSGARDLFRRQGCARRACRREWGSCHPCRSALTTRRCGSARGGVDGEEPWRRRLGRNGKDGAPPPGGERSGRLGTGKTRG
jgi:hypothetical protein